MTLRVFLRVPAKVLEVHQTLEPVREPDGRRLRIRRSTIEIFKIFERRFCIKTLVYLSGRGPISSLRN